MAHDASLAIETCLGGGVSLIDEVSLTIEICLANGASLDVDSWSGKF